MLAIFACEHKDLCYDHRDHAHKYHVRIVADYRHDWEERFDGVDWQSNWPDNYLPYDDLRPGMPSGLRIVNNWEDKGYNLHNISSTGGVVNLYEDRTTSFSTTTTQSISYSHVLMTVHRPVPPRARVRALHM